MAPADSLTWPEPAEPGLVGAACEGVPEPKGVEICTEVEIEDEDADMDEMIIVVGGTVEIKADVVA